MANGMVSDMVNEIVKICAMALEKGNKLMFCGNGGSAEFSNHLAAEFVCKIAHKRKALNAISLCSNMALITAIANDFGFKYVFSRQLEAAAKAGDVLFCISTSGKSENILEACALAKKLGVITVAMTQKNTALQELADYSVLSDGTTAQIQEQQLVLGHKFVMDIEKALNL